MEQLPGNPEPEPQEDLIFASWMEPGGGYYASLPYLDAEGSYRTDGRAVLGGDVTTVYDRAPDGKKWSTAESIVFPYILAANLFQAMFQGPTKAELPPEWTGEGYGFLEWGSTPAVVEE